MSISWSYSALTSFETCARKHYETKIAKRFIEAETEQLRWGNRVHKEIEDYLNGVAELSPDLQYIRPLVDGLNTMEGTLLVEEKIALNDRMEPVSWHDKSAWVRGIVDMGKLDNSRALAIDWKTGKRKISSEQLQLMAAIILHTYPLLTKVVTGFAWIKHYPHDMPNVITKQTFKRSALPNIWQNFVPRVDKLKRAHDEDKWLPNPSGLCHGWCTVADCEFNQSPK